MKKCLAFLFALAFAWGASAQKTITPEGADETVRLWDNSTAKYSNYETRDEKWEKPNRMIRTSSCDLCIYKADPECNTGICIVMFPGGGYTKLALGNHSAKWLASKGITAVIVKYRLPNWGHKEAMLEDAMGAIRYMRTRTDIGIDPKKVGVWGSSAGGHLAAWVSNAMPDDEKPAFAIPIYPSITRTEFYTAVKANSHLMGKGFPFQEAIDMSVQNMVTPQTPPTLLMLCDDDNVVSSHSSATYYEALLRHGVKASMHIYSHGGHGMIPYRAEFRAAVLEWLDWLGLMPKSK